MNCQNTISRNGLRNQLFFISESISQFKLVYPRVATVHAIPKGTFIAASFITSKFDNHEHVDRKWTNVAQNISFSDDPVNCNLINVQGWFSDKTKSILPNSNL